MPDAAEISNPTPFVLLLVGLFADDGGAFVGELVLDPQEMEVVRRRHEEFRKLCTFATNFLARIPSGGTANDSLGEWRQTTPATVEESLQAILTLTEEIRFLVQIDLPPEYLLKEFFIRYLKATQPLGGAIWNVDYLSGVRPQIDASLPVECSPESPQGVESARLLRLAAKTDRIFVLPPGTMLPEPEGIVNRTPYLLFVAKLADADEGVFVCQAAFQDKPDKKVLDGYIRYFSQVRAMVAQSLKRRYRGA